VLTEDGISLGEQALVLRRASARGLRCPGWRICIGHPVILVTGATGSIGRQLVRGLRQQVSFRALVRDENKGKALGCDFSVGDFDDPPSVGAAMTGVDCLFLNALHPAFTLTLHFALAGEM